jgi:hypothetical protein
MNPPDNTTGENDPSTSRQSDKIGTIVGAVIGSVVGGALIVAGIYFYFRRGRKANKVVELQGSGISSNHEAYKSPPHCDTVGNSSRATELPNDPNMRHELSNANMRHELPAHIPG